jgi:hypothetical protein
VKDRRKLPSHGGRPGLSAGPCRPVHKTCPLRSLTSLQPHAQPFPCYLCSCILQSMPAARLTSLPHTSINCPTQLHSLARFFSTPAKSSPFRVLLYSFGRSVVLWEPRGFILSHGETTENRAQSSISFLFPTQSENSGRPITRLATSFHAGILLGLIVPEDGVDMFLRNVG